MADVVKRFESIVKKLRETHHTLTPQRIALSQIPDYSDGHPDIESNHAKLQVDYPTSSLATVYRNEMLIKSLGEVLELGFADWSNRYDGHKPYPYPN